MEQKAIYFVYQRTGCSVAGCQKMTEIHDGCNRLDNEVGKIAVFSIFIR